MYQKILEGSYLQWMYDIMCENRIEEDKISYADLFLHLYNTEFEYTIPMDENRYADGISLRRRYYNHIGVEYDEYTIDSMPCSMLEMMIALAIRCEENITDDPAYGDRTSNWFWIMISSLGLNGQWNEYYDEEYVNDVLDRFMRREYKPDGEGGLFHIKGTTEDLRNLEIWVQLMRYLNKYVFFLEV